MMSRMTTSTFKMYKIKYLVTLRYVVSDLYREGHDTGKPSSVMCYKHFRTKVAQSFLTKRPQSFIQKKCNANCAAFKADIGRYWHIFRSVAAR